MTSNLRATGARLLILVGWLAAGLTLGACTITAPVFDTEEAVNAVAVKIDEPPSLTLYTVQNDLSGWGEHNSLLINGSQRVLYDPAGRFKNDAVREQGDVLFGVTPEVLADYHAFQTEGGFTAVTQRIEVDADVAEQAIAAARAQGRSSDGWCTVNTAEILRKIEGFEDIGVTFWPNSLMRNFAERSGVRVRRVVGAGAS